jgi:hypothetical protein
MMLVVGQIPHDRDTGCVERENKKWRAVGCESGQGAGGEVLYTEIISSRLHFLLF